MKDFLPTYQQKEFVEDSSQPTNRQEKFTDLTEDSSQLSVLTGSLQSPSSEEFISVSDADEDLYIHRPARKKS